MNLTTNPPTAPGVIADIPTGVSADYDGPLGIVPASNLGTARLARPLIAEMTGPTKCPSTTCIRFSRSSMAIPGLPFITFIDMSGVVGQEPGGQPSRGSTACRLIRRSLMAPIRRKRGCGPAATESTIPFQGSGLVSLPPQDPGADLQSPSCILGQIYYDGAGGAASGGVGLNASVPVDNVGGTFPALILPIHKPSAASPASAAIAGSRHRSNSQRTCLHHSLPSRPHRRQRYGNIL